MPSFGGVAKEAVTFLISGDASGLIKTFGDVEKAADKSLGKTQSSIEKMSSTLTKVGAVSVGAGLSTALGLTSAIKDFEDTEAAANKLDTAVKGMGSGIDTGQIKDLAFQLQQVSKVTDDQVVAAARWGAVYGLTTQQLEQLLTVAVDLSAQTGQSLDKVTKQLASVSTGGSDKMLKKWGVQFDETALKANAFAETMKAAGDFSAGAAAKSVDNFSGQLTRLKNNWDDVKSGIGAGANEVFQPLVSGAADIAAALAQSNPELLKAIGHFTALGSIATTAFGGLATVGGQLTNIREGFKGVSGFVDKFGVSLGTAAVGGGALAIALGLGANALENYANTQKKVSANADEILTNFKQSGDAVRILTDQLNKSSAESEGWAERVFGGGTDKPQIESLNKLGIGVGDVTRAVSGSLGTWNKYNELVQNAFENGDKLPKGLPKKLENLVKPVFDAVQRGVPGAADMYAELTDAMNESSAAADLAGARAKDQAQSYVVAAGGAKKLSAEQKSLADIAEHDPSLDNRLAALDKLAALNPKVAESVGLIADADKKAADEADKQAKAMQKQISGFEDLVKNSKSGEQSMRDFAESVNQAGAKGLATSLEQLDTDEVTAGFLDMGDAMTEMKKTAKDLPPEFNALQAATGGYSKEQEDAIKATTGFASSLKAQASQLLASGSSVDFVKGFLQQGRQAIVDAGGEKWLEQLGLTDQQIDIAIKLAGEDEAQQKLLLLSDMINNDFPPGVVREINLKASTGDFTGALAVAKAEMVSLQISNKEINIDANADGVTSAVEFANYLLFTGLLPPPAVPIDANNDGVISEVEATNFLLSQGITPPPTVSLDADNSGTVSVVEANNYLLAHGIVPPPASQLDADNDGTVTVVEANNYLLAHGIKTPPATPLTASDQASPTIRGVATALSGLDGSSATVSIRTVGEQEARQHIQEIKDAAGGASYTPPSGTTAPPAATPHSTTTSNVTNVVVNIPAGANGRDIERTMRRYAARNGNRRGARAAA